MAPRREILRGWRRALGRSARHPRLIGALIATMALAVFVGFGYTGLVDQAGLITACVKKKGGQLRVIDAEAECRRRETRLTFHQEGPEGERGPEGPAGPPGAQGPAGPPGDSAYSVVKPGTCTDIQAAIDALPNTGGTVLVTAGVYTCSDSIVIDRDGVTLRGTGPGTVLKLADHANRPVLILGQTTAIPTSTRNDIRITDLFIDGNRAQQDFECSTGPCMGSDYLRNNGISLRRVADVLIDDVTVESARSGGLVTELGSRRVTIRDFTTFDNEFDGIAAYQTEDSLFTGLYLHGNQGAGLSFDLDFNNNTIAEAVLADNKDVGVFMRDARDNIFSAVRVRDSGSHGMFLAENDQNSKPALGNTFTGMVISGSGQDLTKGGFGIRVNDASCTHNLVVATQFIGNRDGDVSEATPGLVTKEASITR